MSWAEIVDALNSTKKNLNLFKPLDEWLKYRGGDIAYEYESAGTFSLTVPEWATIAIVTACGGGGGGNYMTYDSSIEDYVADKGGAGGCAICNKIYTVTGGASLSINVGKGGAGGKRQSSTTTAPTNGGSTRVGSLVTLVGGTAKSTSSSGQGSGGAGNVGLTGGVYASNAYCGGGSLGNGGCRDTSDGDYLFPTRGGGGGAAMYHSGNGYDTGQDGADGYVKIVFK